MARKTKETTKLNIDNFENNNKLTIITRKDGTHDFSECTEEKFIVLSEEEKYHLVYCLISIIQNFEKKCKAKDETAKYYEKLYDDEYKANHTYAAELTNYKAQKYRQIDCIKKRLEFLQNYVNDIVDTFIDNENLN